MSGGEARGEVGGFFLVSLKHRALHGPAHLTLSPSPLKGGGGTHAATPVTPSPPLGGGEGWGEVGVSTFLGDERPAGALGGRRPALQLNPRPALSREPGH